MPLSADSETTLLDLLADEMADDDYNAAYEVYADSLPC
jgi:hypothetical protein